MADISAGGKAYPAELIVFDKDGTLIDFYRLWGGRAQKCVHALADHLGSRELSDRLFQALGYDPSTGIATSEGPLATAPLARLLDIARSVLIEYGFSPDTSRSLVRDRFAVCLGAIPSPDLIVPLGGAQRLLARLTGAGVTVAVVTSDDRPATQAALEILGVDPQIGYLVCGDDPVANKPAPDALIQICQQSGISPDRAIVVGDNPGDLIMGRRAGARCCIGVLSGTSNREELAPVADLILDSFGEIEILSGE